MTRLCVFPFIAGFLTRYFFKKAKGEDWYIKNVLPRILAVQNSYLAPFTSDCQFFAGSLVFQRAFWLMHKPFES
jgi:hypothetical protein